MSQIKWPTDFSGEDHVGNVNYAFVCLDSSSSAVVISPHNEEYEEALRIEKVNYERFEENGGHAGLLR